MQFHEIKLVNKDKGKAVLFLSTMLQRNTGSIAIQYAHF